MTSQTQVSLADAVGRVGHLHQTLGWIATVSSKVSFPGVPQDLVRAEQSKVDQMAGSLGLVYVFAAFEDAIPLFTIQSALLLVLDRVTGSPDLREQALGYRHLRHVAAHGFNGDRSGITGHRNEFERSHGKNALRGVLWDRQNDRVTIPGTAYIEAAQVLKSVGAHLMNTPEAR